MVRKKSVYLLLYSCTNPILGKSQVPEIWMGQNTLGQSDCRIFKSIVSLQENYLKAWFFAYWYRFMDIGAGLVKNGCGHSGLRALNSAVSEERINWLNWFWCVDKNSEKPKVHFDNFWVVVVKNGRGFFGCGTPKNLLNELLKWADFFACWYRFRKFQLLL